MLVSSDTSLSGVTSSWSSSQEKRWDIVVGQSLLVVGQKELADKAVASNPGPLSFPQSFYACTHKWTGIRKDTDEKGEGLGYFARKLGMYSDIILFVVSLRAAFSHALSAKSAFTTLTPT